MRKLYEIRADIEDCILNATDPETGELLDTEQLDKLMVEHDTKIENVALYVKDSRAEAAAIKAEIEELKKRMDRLNRNADGAEGWLEHDLNGQKFTTARCECVFRKSLSVEVEEGFCEFAEAFELEDLITVKRTVTPNKTAIKKLLKDGGELEFCHLVEKQNISIK